MKRMIILIVFMMMTIGLNDVQGTLLSSKLPGGKNYLDEDNFVFTNDSIISIDSIKVKPFTEYTISLPSSHLLEEVVLNIFGDTDYFSGLVREADCTLTDVNSFCTFTTANDDYLTIELYSEMFGLYYTYYKFDLFMLEEGNVVTEYEVYIPPLLDTNSPEFANTGAYITTYNDSTSIENIVSNHVTALDDIDGDISDLVIIKEDNYTLNTGIVGEYSVLLEIEDNNHNIATFDLLVIVKDEIPPVITGPSSIDVNVNNIPLLEDVISEFSITDEYDGPLMYTVTEDNYSNQTSTGDYNVSIETTDSSNNKAIFSFSIAIEDIDVPSLISSSIFEYSVENTSSTTEIINLLETEDNYSEQVLINIVNDQYNPNRSVVGTYFIDIELLDESNNVASYTLTINVVDSIPPTLSGPSTLQYGYQHEVAIESIIEMLEVSDNVSIIDISDVYVISNELSNKVTKTGEFNIVFGVLDESGLETTFTVKIILVDDQLPIIFVDDYIVKINQNVTFTHQDALKLLRHSNQLTDEDYEVKTLINEYEGNEHIPGMYLYQVQFKDLNGNIIVKDFVIEVLDEKENYTSLITSGVVIVVVVIGVFIKKRK